MPPAWLLPVHRAAPARRSPRTAAGFSLSSVRRMSMATCGVWVRPSWKRTGASAGRVSQPGSWSGSPAAPGRLGFGRATAAPDRRRKTSGDRARRARRPAGLVRAGENLRRGANSVPPRSWRRCPVHRRRRGMPPARRRTARRRWSSGPAYRGSAPTAGCCAAARVAIGRPSCFIVSRGSVRVARR